MLGSLHRALVGGDARGFSYVSQLIESVDHLGIPLEHKYEQYGFTCVVLNLSKSPYTDLGTFSEKWQRIKELFDNGMIEADEYQTLMDKRLVSLDMTKYQPFDETDPPRFGAL